ncbi:uncharacterized protein VTP21DRAFT_9051 [Calcarisporiella thermophila]|uniref:uncharacterized protein n=1 Tax=Calcarisporiella thermophila TaxID=911321 RepID=UPI00374289C4
MTSSLVSEQGFSLSERYENCNDPEQNRKIAVQFLELLFGRKDMLQHVVDTYISSKYVEHSPKFPDGKEGFYSGMNELFKKVPDLSISVRRSIAEKDMVWLHVHLKANETDLGSASVDIYRFEDGKIAEHWAVDEHIPEKSMNNNGMI